jgi:hypothetical protein
MPVLDPETGLGLDAIETGTGRWWLVDGVVPVVGVVPPVGVVPVERRGGGRAGGGFEAERRACPGIGGTRWEVVAELRRSVVAPAVEGVVGVSVVGPVCGDVGPISTPSGMVLRSLLVPAEC